MDISLSSVLLLMLPGVLLVWLPVVWAAIIAKVKKLSMPVWFSVISGCFSNGIVALIGVFFAAPMYFVLNAGGAGECDTSGYLCIMYNVVTFAKPILSIFGMVVVPIATPFILNKYVWQNMQAKI